MSNKTISMDVENYRISVNEIKSMAENVTVDAFALPEMSGTNVPTMLEYIKKFEEFNAVLVKYKEMLMKDIKKMKKIGDTFEEMDKNNSIK